MSAKKTNNSDYDSLASAAKKGGADARDRNTLKPLNKFKKEIAPSQSLLNRRNKPQKQESPSDALLEVKETARTDFVASALKKPEADNNGNSAVELTYSQQQKQIKKVKKAEKDRLLLRGDRWLARNGHTLSFIGLYLFSIMVLFRPYELFTGLGFLSATAFYFALATLIIYVPSQLITEGNLTVFPIEVKAIFALTLIAVISIPIAREPALAWSDFNGYYIRAVLIFIVIINVVRTRRRLMGMIWLSLSIGVVLSYLSWKLYLRGEMKVEGYRVGLEIGGMFENPNEMSLHLVMMIPLAVTLGIAEKSSLMRVVYFGMAAIMLFANMITYSRGGFLALIASTAFLIWKLGRKNRLGVGLAAGVIGFLAILLAPGNFGTRILSIFIPGLDPVGSSSQRQELLERSIIVTLRNPWGIGMGNFPIVGVRNLVSHNAYTQVSSELGLLGLAAYLVFIIMPFRKLGAIERTQFEKNDLDWFYYLAIGLQASLISYWVGSFFASVAYHWFIYYLVAYAIAFRRTYKIEKNLADEVEAEPLLRRQKT